MNEWNEGYFTASTYTYGYYRELSPAYQKFCLLMRGFDSPTLDETGRHCELGYGQGLSINIHAASNPGRYLGTDFNPSHAAHANELARASGADIVLLDDSFEQLLERTAENNPGGGGTRGFRHDRIAWNLVVDKLEQSALHRRVHSSSSEGGRRRLQQL